MRATLALMVLSITLGAAGCAHRPVYQFTQTAAGEAQAKAPDCAFAVAGTLTDPSAYVEIGVLEYKRTPPREMSRFKEVISAEVCQAGGDLVVGEINGFGYYVRGVVFKKRGVAAN